MVVVVLYSRIVNSSACWNGLKVTITTTTTTTTIVTTTTTIVTSTTSTDADADAAEDMVEIFHEWVNEFI